MTFASTFCGKFRKARFWSPTENNVPIELGGASTKLLSEGLYDFDADHSAIRVFTGKAEVYANDRKVKVREQQQLILNSGNWNPNTSILGHMRMISTTGVVCVPGTCPKRVWMKHASASALALIGMYQPGRGRAGIGIHGSSLDLRSRRRSSL